MYINNLTGKPIKDISFEGFWFSIPAGISLCWDKFGEMLLTKIYPANAPGGGVPPVVRSTAQSWDGVRYVDVRRFEINSELVPARTDLLKIAKRRGVDAQTIENWKEDEQVSPKEIAQAINDLDVPDHIKYPAADETTTVSDSSKDAEAALDEGRATLPEDTETKAAPTGDGGTGTPTGHAPASTPGTRGGKRETVAKKTPRAAGTPRTRRAPVK